MQHSCTTDPVPGIKNDSGNWDLRGHCQRIVTITERELALFATLFEESGTPALQARLPQVHSQQILTGTGKDEFLDNRQEHGNAFDLFVRAQRFLRDHLPVASRFEPDSYLRTDIPAIPTAALREAIANALCHHDYTSGAGSVDIAIYSDRVEITNIGQLHFGLTPEALRGPHPSKPWNPVIANAFYRRGAIETWGRGTNKICELVEAAGLPAPEFFVQPYTVGVRFFRPRTPPVTPQAGTKLGLSRDQVLAMTQLTADKTLMEILEVAGRSNRTKFRDQVLNPLLQAGLVEMTIPDKPNSRLQKYRLTEKGRAVLAESGPGRRPEDEK